MNEKAAKTEANCLCKTNKSKQFSTELFVPNAGAVSVIGSTGSIGQTALKVIKKLGLRVSALVAHSNLQLLKRQVDEFNPDIVGVIDTTKQNEARSLFGQKLVLGMEALTVPCAITETVLVSVTGLNGIHPLMEALRQGKRVALANKESLVAGGELIARTFGGEGVGLAGKKLAQKTTSNVKCAGDNNGGVIIPIDSEHSAVFQCLASGTPREIDKIILTASGGAFYTHNKAQLDAITPDQIHHPNWSMGRKITLDSCTMMNKALEIIEAYWLFGTDRIDYVVHRESIIHSMVRFVDGSVIAQLAPPDMSLPIQYALTYPSRCGDVLTDGMNFEFDKPLTFLKKNDLFCAPSLAMQAIKMGGTAGTILNAANEAATLLFENRQISFTDIVKITEKCLTVSDIVPINSLLDITSNHEETMKRVFADYKVLLA